MTITGATTNNAASALHKPTSATDKRTNSTSQQVKRTKTATTTRLSQMRMDRLRIHGRWDKLQGLILIRYQLQY
jgi:hypothetical protein